MSNYDSGNVSLNRLHELIEDLKINEDNYNSWEIDFISDLEDKIQAFEIGDDSLSVRQIEKIDELYENHGLVE